MKIVELKSENVKRIRAVEIRPEGAVVQITGRNGQGKSSVLDSIEMALAGGDSIPNMPIRQGESKARIVVQLDNGLVVKRVFTAAGSTLVVENADGAKFPSPQAMLDKLVGKLTFDPLAFARQAPRDQLETLKSLVGLDFTDADQKRTDLYTERTAVNRVVKQLEGQLAGIAHHADAPAAEVSIAALAEEQRQAMQIKAANDGSRRAATGADQAVTRDEQVLLDAQKSVKQAESILAEAKRGKDATERVLAESRKLADKLHVASDNLVDPDISAITTKMGEAESVNNKVRANKRRAEVAAQLRAAEKNSDTLSKQIEGIDDGKQKQLAAAKFPVAGLSFDSTGVLFNGIPFGQASSAEQLRVSVAMGLAMNPKLKVLLIRDGSLLDAESMGIVTEMITAADGQLWIERVSDGERCGVVIEDGRVQEEAQQDGK